MKSGPGKEPKVMPSIPDSTWASIAGAIEVSMVVSLTLGMVPCAPIAVMLSAVELDWSTFAIICEEEDSIDFELKLRIQDSCIKVTRISRVWDLTTIRLGSQMIEYFEGVRSLLNISNISRHYIKNIRVDISNNSSIMYLN